MVGTASRITARVAPALAALALALSPPAARAGEPFQLLSAEEVSKVLGQPGVHLYDANPREVFEAGRVPGARFVEGDLARLLPREKDAKLVFYCKNPK